MKKKLSNDISVFSNVPNQWCLVTLDEIMKKIVDGTHHTPKYIDKGIPFLSVKDIRDGQLYFDDCKYVSREEHKQLCQRCYPELGDLLITKSGTIGRCAIIKTELLFSLFVSVALLKPANRDVNIAFVSLAFQAWFQTINVQNDITGSAIKNLHLVDFRRLSIPLPPLNEQKRIVTKIEALQTRSSAVKEELEAIKPLLDQFRQSVLAAAFRGDLTKDWRSQNPDVEPAEVLLERIRIERKLLYKKECEKAKAEGKRKPKPFKENVAEINYSLPVIPNTWKWDRFVNLANILGGVTKGRKFKDKETIMLPYLRVANVQDGYLDLREIKEIQVLPEDTQKYHLEYGDILVTEGGDRDKLGRGTIWQNEIENCIHQNHVYRARLYHSDLSFHYISLVLKSDIARKYFFNNASQTTNLASINITMLGNVPLAIPPKDEQKEIVRRIESLFKLADSIEQQYQQAEIDLETLNQSILAKAFRGELVPQNPNDEPASVLLERIREEREKAKPKKSKSKKKSSSKKQDKQLGIPGM